MLLHTPTTLSLLLPQQNYGFFFTSLHSIPYFVGGLSINVLIKTQASRDISTKLKKMFKLELITPILNYNSLQSTDNCL